MKSWHLILLVIMNFFWAGSYSAFKALMPYLDVAGIVTFRFGVAAIAALLLWPLFGGKIPRGRDLITTILMGVIVFSIGPRLQVAGVLRGQAGDSSVLVALEPLICSIGAAIFLREHIALRRWLGFSLGILGVAAMAQIWRADFKLPGLLANALFVSSFICETAWSVMGKPLIERAGLMKIVTISLVSGTVVNLILNGQHTIAAAQTLPVRAWLLVGYLGLPCTLLGYSVWYVVIRTTQVNVTALTIFIQPVVGLFIATVMLNEKLHWGQFWGSAAIIAGLIVGLPRSAPEKIR